MVIDVYYGRRRILKKSSHTAGTWIVLLLFTNELIRLWFYLTTLVRLVIALHNDVLLEGNSLIFRLHTDLAYVVTVVIQHPVYFSSALHSVVSLLPAVLRTMPNHPYCGGPSQLTGREIVLTACFP